MCHRNHMLEVELAALMRDLQLGILHEQRMNAAGHGTVDASRSLGTPGDKHTRAARRERGRR